MTSYGVLSTAVLLPTVLPSRRTVTSSLRQHLCQPVRDVDDAYARASQVQQRAVQVLDLLGTERGRRLVEDQQLCLPQQGAGDLDEFPFAGS